MIRGAALTQGESSELVALPGNTSVSSKPCLTHYYLKQFGARPCIQCTTGQNPTSYRSTMLHSRGVRRRRFADCGGFNAGLRGGDPLCKRVLLNVVPSSYLATTVYITIASLFVKSDSNPQKHCYSTTWMFHAAALTQGLTLH